MVTMCVMVQSGVDQGVRTLPTGCCRAMGNKYQDTMLMRGPRVSIGLKMEVIMLIISVCNPTLENFVHMAVYDLFSATTRSFTMRNS